MLIMGGLYRDRIRAGQLDGIKVWTPYCLTTRRELQLEK